MATSTGTDGSSRRLAVAAMALAVLATACVTTEEGRPPTDDAAATPESDAPTDPTEPGGGTTTGSTGPVTVDLPPDAPLPADFDLSTVPTGEPFDAGPAPVAPDGEWSDETVEQLDAAIVAIGANVAPTEPIDALIATGDPRLAWALTDLQRFIPRGPVADEVDRGIEELTGSELDPTLPWNSAVDRLIAWDLPVPDRYVEFKRRLYTTIDPRWDPLFAGPSTIDWRHVSWGGVFIDDRPAGTRTTICQCIPALDDPPVTDAAGGDWYPDDRIVFGVVIDGEARAYPKNIMEVHEMVNDSLGGRRIAIPYCTLCGSAQAYLTDELADGLAQPTLRTSGLLIRSNKMMFDLETYSFIDTFRGEATSGSLLEAGVTLRQVSVVTATWGQWKADHPDTTILAADGGLGRTYDLDPLDGRDDDGPIFPIGPVDTRLPVQEQVLGVMTDDGRPLAFHVATARDLLADGHEVRAEGVSLVLDGDGVRAWRADGTDARGHQSFWFAWSQFRPGTKLWPHDYVG